MAAAPKLTIDEMKALHAKALAAADRAFAAAQCTPMIVYEPNREKALAGLMGGDDGGIAEAEHVYEPVMDGPCGFAWVTIRPGTSRFARFIKREGIGRTDSYAGGMRIWAPGGDRFSQSYQRKIAAASAYAMILRDAGINAYPDGRLD